MRIFSAEHKRSESAELQETVVNHPECIQLVVGDKINSGAQGNIFNATLFFLENNPAGFKCYPCVVKSLKEKKELKTSQEFILQKLLTSDSDSSVNAGLLRLIGIMNATNGCQYAILPKCDAILSDCMIHIRNLKFKNSDLFNIIIVNFFHSMLSGLKNLVDQEIVHGDIKPHNIAFRQSGFCILDFGCAKTYADFKSFDEIPGTPLYIAPEVMVANKQFPFKNDVYAIGQIFRQLLGENAMFQQEHDNPNSHIFAKGSAYQAACQQKEKNNLSDDQYQKQLITDISHQKTFDECLAYIVNAMCEILPEYRPNLQTLQCAFDRLQSFPSVKTVDALNVAKFYFEMSQPVIPTKKIESQSTETTQTPPRVLENIPPNTLSPSPKKSPAHNFLNDGRRINKTKSPSLPNEARKLRF